MREAFEHDIEDSKRKREPGVPIGVRHICKYLQISSQTFYKLHTHHDFPATRLPDGRGWKAHKAQQNPVTPLSQTARGERMESVA